MKSNTAAVPELAVSKRADLERPFQWALGESIAGLAPKVQEHILQPPGTVVVYRGRMRVWRDRGFRGKIATGLLRVGALARFMFPETGEDVEFEMQHAVAKHEDGSLSMTWIRTFRFRSIQRQFNALMRFHPSAGNIVNWHGCWGCLEVELWPRVDGGEIVVISRRQWLTLGFLKIPIPEWLKGKPHVREWQEHDGMLKIRVEIHNALLGHIFGYEGRYSRVDPSAS